MPRCQDEAPVSTRLFVMSESAHFVRHRACGQICGASGTVLIYKYKYSWRDCAQVQCLSKNPSCRTTTTTHCIARGRIGTVISTSTQGSTHWIRRGRNGTVMSIDALSNTTTVHTTPSPLTRCHNKMCTTIFPQPCTVLATGTGMATTICTFSTAAVL